MNSTTFFSKTSPVKLFFIVSIPGAISMLASSLYSIADGVVVGQFLGATAFAAINLALPFVNINFSLADLIGVGSSVPISISLGKKQEKEANNIFTCSCLLIIGMSLLIGAVMFAAAPLLIRLMGAEGDFAKLAVQYMQIYALCSPVTTIVFAFDNYFRICGIIRGSMFLNIFMSVMCAVFEFLFLGVFRWGIWASALASCTGMFICAVIAFLPFIRKKTLLRFCRPRFEAKIIRQIVACGSPSFLSNIASKTTAIIMNAIMVRIGGEIAVSVYGVLMFIDGFIQPLLYGMCDSVQPAIGYNWGSGKFSRVRAIEKVCYIVSAIFSILSAVIIVLFPAQIAKLFMSDADQTVLAMAVGAVQLFSITYITRWFSFATQSFMLAIEKALPATIISASTALIFPVILIAVLYPLGLNGLWLNLPVTSVLAGILSIFILRKTWHEFNQQDSKT